MPPPARWSGRLNRRNGLLATTGRYVPGIEANAARCARGAPLGEFTPIEQD
jgi:hypothetical protein